MNLWEPNSMFCFLQLMADTVNGVSLVRVLKHVAREAFRGDIEHAQIQLQSMEESLALDTFIKAECAG